jgi:hypothetical protein
LTLVVFTAGCGEPSRRLPVSGMVTDEKGAPFEGLISFLPARGATGPAATASIKKGHYTFSQENGPYAGLHRATILRHSTKDMNEFMHPKHAPAAGSGPWKYEVELTPQKPDHHDFVVASRVKS